MGIVQKALYLYTTINATSNYYDTSTGYLLHNFNASSNNGIKRKLNCEMYARRIREK